MTALHFAALNENYNPLFFILSHRQGLGLNVNLGDSMGRRALHMAASSGNVNAVHLLLQVPEIQVDV